MVQCLTHLRAAWRIMVAKARQVRRLLLPPFLMAMALKAWVSVQTTGRVQPDMPPDTPFGSELLVRAGLGVALALMGLLWHRAIYFGPRAPFTTDLALRYWGQGAALSMLAAVPFSPLALGIVPTRLAIFAADAVSVWLILVFGVVVTRAAGGAVCRWHTAWAPAPAASAACIALLLALLLQGQVVAVAALANVHLGAAFLLDGALSFALIVAVLTLMARPGTAHIRA